VIIECLEEAIERLEVVTVFRGGYSEFRSDYSVFRRNSIVCFNVITVS